MKKLTILTALIICYTMVSGQILSSNVIAAAGDYFVKQGYSLSWTMGETISESFIEHTNQLTQGFHQSYTYDISQIQGQALNDKFNISVYPNPTENFFFVEVGEENGSEPIKMALYNTQGMKLLETDLNYSSKEKINVNQFSSDMFILVIMDEENRWIQRYKIVKVNM